MSQGNRRSSSDSFSSSFFGPPPPPWTTTSSPTSPESRPPPMLSPLGAKRIPYRLIIASSTSQDDTMTVDSMEWECDNTPQLDLVSTSTTTTTTTTTTTNTGVNSSACTHSISDQRTQHKIITTITTAEGDIQRREYHPTFLPLIHRHLSTPLHPLISVTTSLPHPSFPNTLLAFHLLTHDQLDDLARYYHQVCPPLPETGMYPIVMTPAWIEREDHGQGSVDLETKRRRFGRFIGLRGCASPTTITTSNSPSPSPTGTESVEEMMRRMEREWNQGLSMQNHHHHHHYHQGSVDSDILPRWKAGCL